MKTNVQNSMFRRISRTGWRVLCWTAIDAILGGLGGVLFGSVFGAFWLLIRQDPSQIASMAAYFSLCGTVAGALVGTYAAMVDTEESPEPVYPAPNFASSAKVAGGSLRKAASVNQSQPRNRLIGVLDAERRGREALASQDPSQN
jgi:hypothetical protein